MSQEDGWTMTADTDQEQARKGINKSRLIGRLVAVPVFFVLFMFVPAGTWTWAKGWLFLGVFFGTIAVVYLYLWRVNPEVVVARTSSHKSSKRWDRILLALLRPALFAILPVAALDDGRFHWFTVPWWVCVLGYVLYLAGMGIVTWAVAVNKFFEPVVRIQTERGHKVIDAGPYAIVRHPGYVAFIPVSVGTALCLGSVWALIPAGLVSWLLILRTSWEDQTLQAELPGYKQYTQRVRYKLVPGVW
jgi:protein-S-isoprenylcysteine O-methyltransferase Ste14